MCEEDQDPKVPVLPGPSTANLKLVVLSCQTRVSEGLVDWGEELGLTFDAEDLATSKQLPPLVTIAWVP
jgi:hypothetical protein